MNTVLLSTTYFGPVQWYQKLARYDQVVIDPAEPFVKQTYRNRCVIATTNGTQTLTVPILHSAPAAGQSASLGPQISDHGNWRHLHWNALVSAYGESPFFEYYADDIRPFFERRWQYLYDFNMDIVTTICNLLDISPNIVSTTYGNATSGGGATHGGQQAPPADFRATIRPKHPLPDGDFTARPYYQVFRQKHGFLPNLSILDLLFNMGNESIFFLL